MFCVIYVFCEIAWFAGLEGLADFASFAGLACLAILEAGFWETIKRLNKENNFFYINIIEKYFLF